MGERGMESEGIGPYLVEEQRTDAPRVLRPLRALIGLALLAFAVGATALLIQLDRGLWHGLPDRHLAAHLVLYCVGALLTCWLGLAILGCAAVGVFSVALALTRRGW